MARLILKCKVHQITIEPLILTDQQNPHSCPLCTRSCKARGWDEYDDLVEKYGVTRKASYTIDVFLREHLNNYSGSLESNLVARFKITAHTSGYTPITCNCWSCGTTFRYFSVTPTEQNPPHYCPYCGKNSLAVSTDSELDCWEVLANHYNMSVPMIKVFYSLFCQQNARTRFSDFVALIKEQMASGVAS